MLALRTPRRRAVVTAFVALTLAAAAPSSFAATKHKAKPKPKPKPVCNLVTDPKGNEGPLQDGQTLADPALDIVSADIATNAQYATAVIRVAKLTIPDSNAPAGLFYRFEFTGAQSQIAHDLYVKIVPTGSGSWAPTWQDGTTGTGVIDTKQNEVRITVPLSALGTGVNAVAPGGPPLRAFKVTADWADPALANAGATEGLQAFQVGQTVGPTTTSTYVMGTPSCVSVGH